MTVSRIIGFGTSTLMIWWFQGYITPWQIIIGLFLTIGAKTALDYLLPPVEPPVTERTEGL